MLMPYYICQLRISTPVAMTSVTLHITDIQQPQENDSALRQIYQALSHSKDKLTDLKDKQPMYL